MLGLVSILLAVAASANTTLVPFEFTFSAVDPVLQYAPIGPRTADTQGGTSAANAPTGASSVTTDGWEITYSGTDIPADKVTYTTIGSGTPKRSTSTAGATVSVSWVGTGLWFYGNSTDANGFSVTVDGFPTNINNTNGILGGIQNLPYKQHQAQLKVQSGTLDLYTVTILAGLETEGPDAASANTTVVSAVAGADKALNPVFDVTSTNETPWTGRWDWAGTAWDHAGTTGQGATFGYKVPPNSSFLVLYGGTSGWNGDYEMSFTPPLSDKSTGTRGSQYSTWRGQDVVLWAGPLDPSQNYTMVLKTLLANWWIDVSKVKTWSALDPTAVQTNGTDTSDKTPKKSSTPVGAIVGGVVGGVAVLIALGVLLWLLRRRRNRTRKSPLDILEGDLPTPTPFRQVDNRNVEPVVQHSNQYPDKTRTAGRLTDEDAVLLSPYPTSPAGSSSDPAGSAIFTTSSSSKQPQGPSAPREITQQEQDGGTVVNLVPPSYDPAWAEAGSSRM